MTPPIFNLGDEVEVIGTSAKFTITQIQQLPDDERKYSDIGMPYYRAGFLRLVNEKTLSPMQMKVKIGMTFLKHLDQIGELQDRLKQHDEEIKGIYDILENHEEIHEGMDERLSTIEKRLSAIETLQFSQQDAIVHFENRLTFVEKIQRDQSDLVGRAIRDGVVEISDFRRKA